MLKSPSEIIKESIPELKNINFNSDNGRNWLSLTQWNARLRGVEKTNIKKYGTTKSSSTLQQYFSECVYMWEDGKYILINEDAYKLIRKFLTSDKFNQL